MRFTHYLTSRGTLTDYRDNALLQIGFFGAFRRSELVSILWENVIFVPEGLTILVTRSKTDQAGEGRTCAIPYGNDILCPVTALNTWREKLGISSGPIFRAISKNGHVNHHPLSSISVNWIISVVKLRHTNSRLRVQKAVS